MKKGGIFPRTKKARDYIMEHQSEYIYGNGFVRRVVEASGASECTVHKLLRELGLDAMKNKEAIILKLYSDGEIHTTEEINAAVGFKSPSSAFRFATRLGLQDKTVFPPNHHSCWKNLDIEQYKGYTQAELAAIFGVTADTICRAAKQYGWKKYLRCGRTGPRRGKSTLTNSK